MSKQDDGGPAFPTVATLGAWSGMSLRDYFAAQALGSALHNYDVEFVDCDAIAAACYGVADAMLSERAKS